MGKDTEVLVTIGLIREVFTEWDRRFREDPDAFVSQAYSLLFEDSDDYGASATPYFLTILDELKNNKGETK